MQATKYSPNYDFSNEGVDWSEYMSEARVRTDAVWERQKLKDYFRLFYKLFLWDPNSQKYYIAMPLHSNLNPPDNWRFKEHRGYNPTGKTNSFERSRGVEYPYRSLSINESDTLRDKNVLCYYRFRTFKKCENNRIYSQIREASRPGKGAEPVDLECYREMTEMLQWCSNVQLNWLADLWHHMEVQNDPTTFGKNDDLKMMMDEFDNPDNSKLSY